MSLQNNLKIVNEGLRFVIGGASGSGKTAFVLELVKKSKRLAVWDCEDQWSQLPGFKRVTTRAELLKAVLSKGSFKVAFVSSNLKADFDYWAQAVFHAALHIAPLDAVAEELADVTSPGKAPQNWGTLVRRGRKHGVNLYAISQRWSEADKTTFGNASLYVVFAQSSQDDVRYISRKTRIPEADINKLDRFEYLTYTVNTKQIAQKRLTFAK